MKSNIFITIITLAILYISFNFDLLYRFLYREGVYNGNINNYEFKLGNSWELCESTEEGFFSYFEYDFKRVKFCDGNGNNIKIFSWENTKLEEFQPYINTNGVEFKFVRYIKSEDRIMLFHSESKLAVSVSPSSNINEIIGVGKR
ncbi:MAG: hypothetical protein KAT04_08375 [Methylococcales bacterium]|nr:hypothetical protein [Methylococcales bacterium]